jgi:hypothetical protein
MVCEFSKDVKAIQCVNIFYSANGSGKMIIHIYGSWMPPTFYINNGLNIDHNINIGAETAMHIEENVEINLQDLSLDSGFYDVPTAQVIKKDKLNFIRIKKHHDSNYSI